MSQDREIALVIREANLKNLTVKSRREAKAKDLRYSLMPRSDGKWRLIVDSHDVPNFEYVGWDAV